MALRIAASKVRESAQSMLEVTIGIVVLVPVVLVLIDLSVMLLGVEMNDINCRNAVRAAAAGAPQYASSRAETTVASNGEPDIRAMVTGSRLVLPVAVNVVSQPRAEPDIAAEKQIFPGGPVIGTTTVTTEIQVRPILIHYFYGGRSPLTFRATHTFPISYVMPAS